MNTFHPIQEIRDEIRRIICEKFPSCGDAEFRFEFPPTSEMGHLALACFPFSRVFKKKPELISAEIVSIDFSNNIQSARAIKGYVNFFINPTSLSHSLFNCLDKNQNFGNNEYGAGKRALIEFSSPNTNKPQHLGHARNNMIGFSLGNLFELSGYQVIRVNLVNDRGIHICKSMLAYKMFGGESTPESTNQKGDFFVGDYYVKYFQESTSRPELEKEAQNMLVQWENGDEDTKTLWEKMKKWVMDGFSATYERMGICFDHFYFESDMYMGGKEEVLSALKKGVCQLEENGAVSIDLEDEGLGKKVLLRGDGTSVYITQDIHTSICKIKDFNPDLSLFVVGNEQENHFSVLFAVLKRFGYEWADNCEHISYGMISLPEGKMKSREGTVVDLDSLLNDVKELAMDQLREREKESIDKRSESELLNAAEDISQAAIKFMILKSNSKKNIVFDPKESISFEGMTGPYLQYTYARICSLLRKSESEDWLAGYPEDHNWLPEESEMLFMIAQLPEKVLAATCQRNPGLITGYAYDLGRLFNKYYYANQIVRHSDINIKKARLALTVAVKHVLRKCLNIIGIKPLERM